MEQNLNNYDVIQENHMKVSYFISLRSFKSNVSATLFIKNKYPAAPNIKCKSDIPALEPILSSVSNHNNNLASYFCKDHLYLKDQYACMKDIEGVVADYTF